MLLAVDIGNTRIKLGVFDSGKLISKVAIPTERNVSAETLLKVIGHRITDTVEAVIVCSVVPEVDAAFREFVLGHFEVEPLIVENDWDLGMTVTYEPLSATGSDRLVNAFSAVETYGAPCIVCSFGTAFTIDVINKHRVLVGGLIAPGIDTLSAALASYASKLPEVTLEKPTSLIQKTTTGCIQAGVFYGFIGMAEYLLSATLDEFGGEAKIIATGGSAKLFAENTAKSLVIDDNLLLNGLQKLYARRVRGPY